MPHRMPSWSDTLLTPGTIQSTHTPATMKSRPNPNDNDRTRAGETNACVVMKAGVKMPPMKLTTTATTMARGRLGAQASRSSPGPTATSTQPARLSGSPIPLASHDAVHRPARSTPAKAAAAPSDPRTPRWNTPRWKARL